MSFSQPPRQWSAQPRAAAGLGEPPHGGIELVVAGHPREPLVVRDRDVAGIPRAVGLVEQSVHALGVVRLIAADGAAGRPRRRQGSSPVSVRHIRTISVSRSNPARRQRLAQCRVRGADLHLNRADAPRPGTEYGRGKQLVAGVRVGRGVDQALRRPERRVADHAASALGDPVVGPDGELGSPQSTRRCSSRRSEIPKTARSRAARRSNTAPRSSQVAGRICTGTDCGGPTATLPARPHRLAA